MRITSFYIINSLILHHIIGHATAQNNLGYCYQYGQGVAPDIHAAVKLYRQSADQGCAFGQNSLGHCYKRGHGVPKNLHEAVKYYRLSAEQGHATGDYFLYS